MLDMKLMCKTKYVHTGIILLTDFVIRNFVNS